MVAHGGRSTGDASDSTGSPSATPACDETWILGIETSCDETAAAVVADGRVVRSSVVASQVALHAPYGGVFPEIASRQHVRDVTPVVEQAMTEAGAAWRDLAAIAVTYGPGLSGSLLVGVNVAKGLAMATGRPLVAVNHLEGHLYSNWLHTGGVIRRPDTARDDAAHDPAFPHLALIVSGGHTDLVHVRGHGDYTVLGATGDDAAGEAFDKAARMLRLGYPGGPAIEQAAEGGDPDAFRLPIGRTEGELDFSFSGLKTAVLRIVQGFEDEGSAVPVADLAASFQAAVVRALVGRLQRALARWPAEAVLVAGGVSANRALRHGLTCALDVPAVFPPLALCTDNAAMIAAAGFWAWQRGDRAGLGLDVVSGAHLGDDANVRAAGAISPPVTAHKERSTS
jgi:N6-L-threonylcarbamoyladenine synthase